MIDRKDKIQRSFRGLDRAVPCKFADKRERSDSTERTMIKLKNKVFLTYSHVAKCTHLRWTLIQDGQSDRRPRTKGVRLSESQLYIKLRQSDNSKSSIKQLYYYNKHSVRLRDSQHHEASHQC